MILTIILKAAAVAAFALACMGFKSIDIRVVRNPRAYSDEAMAQQTGRLQAAAFLFVIGVLLLAII